MNGFEGQLPRNMYLMLIKVELFSRFKMPDKTKTLRVSTRMKDVESLTLNGL